MPLILNAANEVAVEKFLQGKIKFTYISCFVQNVIDKVSSNIANESFDHATIHFILEVDHQTRQIAMTLDEERP